MNNTDDEDPATSECPPDNQDEPDGLKERLLGEGGSRSNQTPMDTGIVYTDGMGMEGNAETTEMFDRKSLFAAASKGDISQLTGLLRYLQREKKHLSDTEFKDLTNGKTVLLKALLNLREAETNNAIEALLDIAEKTGDLNDFVNASYTDIYYKGQTALHVAIERRSFDSVRLLVQRGADVQAKASGTFFQLHARPGFYFGELPLSLAACTNQLDMVSFLLENPYQRADLAGRDAQGNTVLHALVAIADNTSENTDFVTRMYDDILIKGARLCPKVRLEEAENNQRLTPLKLAAKTGKIGLFRHMVGREFTDEETRALSRKFTEWVYGPVHSSLYCLDSLDTYERNSVLEIIVFSSEIPNRHEMLQIEPLHRLLEEKWDKFASKIFFMTFLVYVLYLGIFTTVAFYRKEGQPPFPVDDFPMDYFRVFGELISLIGAVYFFCRGIHAFKRNTRILPALYVDGFSELLFFLQAVFLLVSAALYSCGQSQYVGPLVLSVTLSWINLLYYTRGSKHMGMYNVMMQRMILCDIPRFLCVYIVYLLGFSTAVLTLIDESPPLKALSNDTLGQDPSRDLSVCSGKRLTYNNIWYTTRELVKFTIGMGNLEFTEQFQYKEVFYILLISYILLTYILLLNMLIALMGETVERVSRESESIWKLQRALTILDLEKSLPMFLREKLRSGVEQRPGGLMAGEKSHRFCRVEEVNWRKWRTNLGIIHEEDPGSSDIIRPRPHDTTGRRGQWRMVTLMRRLSLQNQRRQAHPHGSTISPV